MGLVFAPRTSAAFLSASSRLGRIPAQPSAVSDWAYGSAARSWRRMGDVFGLRVPSELGLALPLSCRAGLNLGRLNHTKAGGPFSDITVISSVRNGLLPRRRRHRICKHRAGSKAHQTMPGGQSLYFSAQFVEQPLSLFQVGG